MPNRAAAESSYDSTFRYVSAQASDRNREITLTVIVFDVPKTE